MNKSSHTDDTYKVPYESVDTHVAQGITWKFRDSSLWQIQRIKHHGMYTLLGPARTWYTGAVQCVAVCCSMLHRAPSCCSRLPL